MKYDESKSKDQHGNAVVQSSDLFNTEFVKAYPIFWWGYYKSDGWVVADRNRVSYVSSQDYFITLLFTGESRWVSRASFSSNDFIGWRQAVERLFPQNPDQQYKQLFCLAQTFISKERGLLESEIETLLKDVRNEVEQTMDTLSELRIGKLESRLGRLEARQGVLKPSDALPLERSLSTSTTLLFLLNRRLLDYRISCLDPGALNYSIDYGESGASIAQSIDDLAPDGFPIDFSDPPSFDH